jgi:hypothetical protein
MVSQKFRQWETLKVKGLVVISPPSMARSKSHLLKVEVETKHAPCAWCNIRPPGPAS